MRAKDSHNSLNILQDNPAFRGAGMDTQDFLFPVNQQIPKLVKTYNYILIRSSFRKALKIDGFAKSRHSGENRSPETLQLIEKTGFRLSPE